MGKKERKTVTFIRQGQIQQVVSRKISPPGTKHQSRCPGPCPGGSGQLVPGVQREPPVLWFGPLSFLLVLALSSYPRILQ